MYQEAQHFVLAVNEYIQKNGPLQFIINSPWGCSNQISIIYAHFDPMGLVEVGEMLDENTEQTWLDPNGMAWNAILTVLKTC